MPSIFSSTQQKSLAVPKTIEEASAAKTDIKMPAPIRQFFTGAYGHAPFGKRLLKYRKEFYESTPEPKTTSGKVARILGSLGGDLPSFSAGAATGGLASGGLVKAGTSMLKVPHPIAKAAGAVATGIGTFMAAKSLRNIGQNRPVTEGLPEEAKMGAIWGPTGLIRSRIGSAAAGTTLGALTAPKGEKTASGLTFGVLSALSHGKSKALSPEERSAIDSLYKESSGKQSLRKSVRESMSGKTEAKMIPLIEEAPMLKKGQTAYGEGFTVTGGKTLKTSAQPRTQLIRPTTEIKTAAEVMPESVAPVEKTSESKSIFRKQAAAQPVKLTIQSKVEKPFTKPQMFSKEIGRPVAKWTSADWAEFNRREKESEVASTQKNVQDAVSRIELGSKPSIHNKKLRSAIDEAYVKLQTVEGKDNVYDVGKVRDFIQDSRILKDFSEVLDTPVYIKKQSEMGNKIGSVSMTPDNKPVIVLSDGISGESIDRTLVEELIHLKQVAKGKTPDAAKTYEEQPQEITAKKGAKYYSPETILEDVIAHQKSNLPLKETPEAPEFIPRWGRIKKGDQTQRVYINSAEKLAALKSKPGVEFIEDFAMEHRPLTVEETSRPEEKYTPAFTQKDIKSVEAELAPEKLRVEEPAVDIAKAAKRKGQEGFVSLEPLKKPVEYTSEQAGKIYRGLAPASEVTRNNNTVSSLMEEVNRKTEDIKAGGIPPMLVKQRQAEIAEAQKLIKEYSSYDKGESKIVTDMADAVDAERMFLRHNLEIANLAEKVGITEGSEASRTIFRVLDGNRATAKEIAKLTPDQKKFIDIFKNMYAEAWEKTGLPQSKAVREYATHLISDGIEKGYDISRLGESLPNELHSRFLEKRRGAKQYSEDIVKAVRAYVPSIGRKIYREPTLEKLTELVPNLSKNYRNEVVDLADAFLGRGRYKGESALGDLPNDLIRLTYRGTLYGNFSAALKNATQIITNTVPEIGKYTGTGLRKLMTPEGKQEFINSTLANEVTSGRPIDTLDFFSAVEFINRGSTYLGAKAKYLKENPGDRIKAEEYARKITRRTQFIQTGIDVPKFYRQYGVIGRGIGQFAQFPTKQAFFITNMVRNKEWNKLARFAVISYMLGGTDAFPGINGIIEKLPDEAKKNVLSFKKYSSIADLSGMNIGQNFGFGTFENVPLGRGPAIGAGQEAIRLGLDYSSGKIASPKEVFRSRFVQRSIPTMIPGGVAMKKTIDLMNADLNDYKIETSRGELHHVSSPAEQSLRVLVGSTKKRALESEEMFETSRESSRYKYDHTRMLDAALAGDDNAITDFIKKYPGYNPSNLMSELKNRHKSKTSTAVGRQLKVLPKALRR